MKEKIKQLIYFLIGDIYLRLKVRVRNKPKVFVIGLNKTGTTTLQHALAEHGFIMGHQRTAELLMNDIMDKKYDSLLNYCKTAEAFQDVPFSIPGMYKRIDSVFPNSKFILSIRNDDNKWFQSITKFHSKLWGDGQLPTEEVLNNVEYVYKGYALKTMKFLYGEQLYAPQPYKEIYNRHISDIHKYFASKPKQLLTINIESEESYLKFCTFLNLTPNQQAFEWKNKT